MRVIYRAAFMVTTGLLLAGQPVVQAKPPGYQTASADATVKGKDFTPLIPYRNEAHRLQGITDPSGKYFRLFLPGHHHTSVSGQPELPVYSRLMEVPADMTLEVTLTGIKSKRIRFTEYAPGKSELFPVQPARTKNQKQDEKVSVKDSRIYKTEGTIVHDTVTVTSEGIFRGRKLVNIAVYPAFYNPSAGYVDLITSMDLHISLKPSQAKGGEEELLSDDKGGYASASYIPGYTDRPVNMVIVTDSLFRKHLTPLVRWKMLKGIRTKIFYKGAGPADTVYYDVKKRISEYYFTSLESGIPVQYLLIVGDPSVVPTSRGTGNVSDLYYGEFDGEGDYIPELFIGRLPVADTTQLKQVVKKIIDYETFSYSPSNKFWAGALATAGNAPGIYETYMNGQVQYIYDNYLEPDTSLNAVRWLFPDAPLKDDSLKLLFNSGLGILNYTGHGEASGFSDPVFKVSTIKELTNIDKYPLIIANACRTAQINVTPNFGSSIVTASDKGALGYIGCTNDSYWTDDFFWAVGPGTPGLDVTYENTGAGAFDRLFHTHDEPPGEWYHTMGQINFSGNMSVSASTSPRKRYYWETYILLGDPSLSPVIGRPDTFDIELPDRLPQELESLNFFAKPFAYAAISDFDTLWDARFVSPSGNISLSLPPGVKDSCLLVVTGQNMLPLMKTLYFGDVTGPYLVTGDIEFDDSDGTTNGLPDYGETINLRVTITNLGKSPTSNLISSLSVSSGMITIGSGTEYIGVINPGSSYTIDGSFLFTVSDEVEDGELASLLLSLTDNGNHYRFGIDMTLLAPQLEIISSVHDDTATGNSNFLPDPGETINLRVTVKNKGSSAADGTVTLSPSNPLLNLQNGTKATGMVLPGKNREIVFETTISDYAYPGTVIPYDVSFVSGKYEARGTWSLSTGKTRETWEFDRFDVFPWIRQETNQWTITSSDSWENILSARTGAIADKNSSVLAIKVNNPVKDTLSFWSRVSSEPIYDQLVFRIDSANSLALSGDTPWELHKFALAPGVHYLEWIYSKDVSLSGGLDAAWIDQITFPDIAFLDADLNIDTVYPPDALADLGNIIIKGRIVNLGLTALTSFPLAYRINAGDPVIETFFVKIDPGDTVDVSFATKSTFLPDVSYLIEIISRLPEDGYPGNDTARVSFVKSGTGPEIPAESVRALPNPFRDNFVLEVDFEGSEPAELEIIDVTGRIVMRSSYELTSGRNRIPFRCQHLPPGVYTLKIIAGGRSHVLKMVKVIIP